MAGTATKWWWVPGALFLLSGSVSLFVAVVQYLKRGEIGFWLVNGFFWFALAATWFRKIRQRAAANQGASTSHPDHRT